jgi:MFS family permease
MPQPSHTPPPLRVAWLIWSLGALFYMMGFFQRVAPAVMTDTLMREFDIGAAALGNLSALYFYSYVAMQIPTGIIADRWGPRRLLSLAAMVAAAGTLLFSLAPGFFLVGVGRLMIGGSVAVAFVGSLQVANRWFPPRYYAMVSGVALLFGIIGAVGAGPPLRLLIMRFGWRPTILASGLATLAIGAAIWIVVRDFPHEKGYADLVAPVDVAQRPSVAAGLKEVLGYRNTLALFIVPGGVVGPVLAFAGLWGVPFLSTHYGLDPSQASALTTALLMAWALGGPVLGWLSDRSGRRKPLYLLGCTLALAGWIVIVYLPGVPLPLLTVVLVATGFFSGGMIIGFAFAKESVPSRLAGTISGFTNMGVMMGPMLLQPAIGWVLDRQWNGQMQGGIRIYSLAAYQTGFALLVAWAALAALLLLFTRETHCRPLHD